MKIINFEDYLKKHNLKNDTMIELDLQRVYNYSIDLRDSIKYSDRGFANIDNGKLG